MNSISGSAGLLNAIQSSYAGINSGLQGLARDAQAVAEAGVDGALVQAAAAMVDSLAQQMQVQLSAKMMRTAHETLGTLINVRA